MSEILKIFGIAIITIAVSAALKTLGSSLSGYITQISAVIIFMGAISTLMPIITFIKDISSGIKGSAASVSTLVLAGAIAIISKIAAELCKENGHEMLKNSVEFAANAEILLLCIPIIRELLRLSTEVMQI